MQMLGRVKQVQIAPQTVKVDGLTHEIYDPAPLLVVEQLRLGPRGVIGLTAVGEQIIDIHHADHPQSRYRGENGISIDFTSHYVAMRHRFGPRLVDGCAGENILIEAQQIVTLSALQSYVVIHHVATEQLFVLARMEVAEPCMPFAHFAAATETPLTPTELRTTLQFLRQGLRGFYLTAVGAEELVVQAGDHIYATDRLPQQMEQARSSRATVA